MTGTMTFEQLRVFVAVAESLHMTRAAAALAITQSSASAAVRALEARVGLALFDRVGRRLELTEAGRVLLPEARAVLGRLDGAADALADLADLARGTLRLAASLTVGGYWLPGPVARFKALHPGLAILVRIGNSAEVARAVAEGEVEIGFVEGAVEGDLLARARVGADRLVCVAGRGRRPARGDLAALAGEPWVLRERGSGTRQQFEAALSAAGIDPAAVTVALELPSNEAVLTAVEAGAGLTAVSDLVARRSLAAGDVTDLGVVLPERPFHALRHGDRRRSRAAAAFLDLLRRDAAG